MKTAIVGDIGSVNDDMVFCITKKVLMTFWVIGIYFITIGTFAAPIAAAETVNLVGSQLESIRIRKQALYPEGMKYNANTDKFLVGSFRDGAVYEIDQDGTYRRLVDDKRIISALGLQIDAKRNSC